MCGRFTLTVKLSQLQLELGLGSYTGDFQSRFNIAPTQTVAIVKESLERSITTARWGLIPSWARDISIGSRLINARAETIDQKPSFRSAFTQRRCLIPADGFYEWQQSQQKSQRPRPFFFSLSDGRPFAFAGIWETWRSPEGKELESCAIITCPANAVVQPVHERMPVILTGDNLWLWLKDSPPQELKQLLAPCDPERMKAIPVSAQVNNPGNDSPDCIAPAV